MHTLVELYTPKTAWTTLPAADRARFVAGVRAAVVELEATGVRCLSLGRVDPSADHPANHAYFGVWSARDEAALRAFLDGLKASGWYDYFDHVNGAGADDGLDRHFDELSMSA